MNKLLFDRLGGTTGITAIVDAVVEAHMCNPAIKTRFLPYRAHPEKMAMIKKHTIDFFSAGSGAAVPYTGRDMITAHAGMNVSPAEYIYAVDDILKVLDEHNIDTASKSEVLYILWSLKNMIIGQ